HWDHWPVLKRSRLRGPGSSGARFTQPAPGDQAKDHGPQGGNETQREVAAFVVRKGMFAREQVQEPLVEAVSEIVVFVPVRGESGRAESSQSILWAAGCTPESSRTGSSGTPRRRAKARAPPPSSTTWPVRGKHPPRRCAGTRQRPVWPRLRLMSFR